MTKYRTVLSVLTICFNEEERIKNTIESVLLQDCTDYEYIIKDGGSSDRTNNIIDEYKDRFAEKGVRFIHIINKDNGTYDAMNQGSCYCSGKYICFLNAGDSFYSKEVIKILSKTDLSADLYYGDAIMTEDKSNSLFKANMDLIYDRMPFSHQSCFIKLKTFNDIKYDVKYKICADYNLILYLFFNNAVFSNLNTIICNYDMGGISSTAFVKKRKEHEEILTKYGINKWYKHFYHLFEAYAKELLFKILPPSILKQFKAFYKYHIKHYENI